MELVGPPEDVDFSLWAQSVDLNGTPGEKNSISELSKPQSPTLVSPLLDQKMPQGDIDFSWQSKDAGVIFEFILSNHPDLSEPIIDTTDLDAKEYSVEDLPAGLYFWQIISSNALGSAPSPISSFELTPVEYSDKILINELYPDPESGDEWIELYNNSDVEVSLKGWALEDLKGSVHQYIISDFVIGPFGYLTILKSVSSITLNNDQDGVRLSWPDGKILYETPIFSDGDKGWGFARNNNGTWQWTTTPTKNLQNKITAPKVEEDEKEDEDKVLNTSPIEIKTGDAKNYENYLVKISGEITQNSGNTFFINDGSGEVKIYLQDSKGIKKPPMHVGDIFEITGVVNFYRNYWRILPQNQGDVKFVKSYKDEEEIKAAVKKKTTAAAKSTKAVTSASKARAPSTRAKNVLSENDNSKTKVMGESTFVQMTKVLTGLAGVLLVILIIKIIQIRKKSIKNTVGGHFGDDLT